MGDTTDPFAAPQPQPQGPLPPSSTFAGQPPQPQGMPLPPSIAAAPQYGQQYPQPHGQQYPPAYGQQYPPPYGQQYPPAYGQQYPPPYGDPYATQYGGYVLVPWRRSWGTSMARWGIGCAVLFVVTIAIGIIAGSGQPTSDDVADVAASFFVGPVFYMPFIPWWLDHVIWRLGKVGAWAIHGAASLVFALLGFAILASPTEPGQDPLLPPDVGAWWMLVVWAVGFPLAMVLADLLPKSYRPKQAA